MMLQTLWDDIGPKWPMAFWDDWLRESAQRKGRSCLRPEISRTEMSISSAKQGVSQYVSFIKRAEIDYFMNIFF
jgi:alpha-1,3-mannosyl-glycoprotein beta-1,2-N-acetylglucosaminyltransferase